MSAEQEARDYSADDTPSLSNGSPIEYEEAQHRNTLTMRMHNVVDDEFNDENDIDLSTQESKCEPQQECIDRLLTAKQNLQALLLDDFEEHSVERLEFLLSSIEEGVRGEDGLISEDIIEFMTYLSCTQRNKMRDTAVQLFIETFDNKFETISHNGELRRPQIGDLLIDAFTDLLFMIVSQMEADPQNEELQQHAHNIMKLITITSKMCVLRHGFTRLFAMYSWCLNSKTKTVSVSSPRTPRQQPPTAFRMNLALSFLNILRECIALNGPEIYLSVETSDHVSYNGLHPMVPIKSRLGKGWSFTSWIRLSREQHVGATQNILSFEGFLRISLKCKENETCSLLINDAVTIETLNLVYGRWHFVCFSHNKNVPAKQDNFVVFIDGKSCATFQVQYPSFASSNNNGIFPLHIGGFCGDMGQSFIYEVAINQVTALPLFCVGATYNPPIYNRSGTLNNHFDRVAAFPRTVRQRAAPMQPRKSGYLLLPFCYGLNPRAVSEVLCLPYGWGYIDICDRKNNMNIVSRPHNKSSLISMGGICYVFYMLSPEFNGATLFSDQQGMNVLAFINELITNNLTLLRQLFTMGLTSIKMYILKYIKHQHRTHLILNQIKELLMIITNCDPTQSKQYFVDGFVNIIMDHSFWIKAPHAVQIAVAQYIHTLIQTQPNEMSSCLSLSDIFDMIRSMATHQVPNNIEIARKLLESAAALIRLKSTQSIIKYSSHRSLSMLICQCDASSLDLQSLLLSTYAEMAHHAPEVIFSQMASKCGFLKVLWDILHCEIGDDSAQNEYIMTELRVKAAKITMGFIAYQGKAMHSSLSSQTPFGLSLVNRSSLDEVTYGVGLSLGSLPPSLPSYSTLLEIVLGKFKLITPSSHRNIHQFDTMHGALVSDKDEISSVLALEGLMKLISVSAYKMRTRMLMDVLSLVKTSDYNQKLFCRQRNSWDKWMVNLISLETGNDDGSACNQLVSQIAATIVWRFLIKDDKGWISVMQLLESLNRKILHLIREDKAKAQAQAQAQTQQSNNISHETKLQCRILHEFLIQVLVLVLNRFLMDQLRSDSNHNNNNNNNGNNNNKMNDLSDSSEHIKSRVSKNLISILDITEWALFNHRFSMLSIPRIRLKQDAKERDITSDMLFETRDNEIGYSADEIRNEILCLKRLLSCSLKFISFKNERQLVLRRLLRYLKEILPHQACHLVFDDVVHAAREFCNRLQIRHRPTKSNTHKHSKKHSHHKSRISIKSENNMKTMRIAYSFLKNAQMRYSRRGDEAKSSKLRALQEEVYAFWGPLLFEDKVDPNTANQMNLPLVSAEESLENMQHHIHSLWVFLQHQKWWEYQFQDKNMKKFKSEYVAHDKEEKKKKQHNKEQFDKYYAQCTVSFEVIDSAETERITQSIEKKRKKKRENSRDLKKYMDFFDEDFQCRFPNRFTPDFWELDPRESVHDHTRLLLVRNFKGSNHSHAAVQSTRKRGKSKASASAIKEIQKNLKNDGPRAKLLRQISEGITTDLKKKQSDDEERKEKEEEPLIINNNNVITETEAEAEADADSEDMSQSDDDDADIKYQTANLSGKKILIEVEATCISPFYKISGKMYVSEHHLIFEGHDYIENVHEQNAADQIKLTQQRYDRERRLLLDSTRMDDALIKQLESENKQQTESILATNTNKQSDIIEYEIWSLSHIKHLYPRRYLLRENGLEIWIAGTSKSFFFTFGSARKRGEVIANIVKHSPRFLKANASKDLLVNPLKMLAHLGLTDKWRQRKISNFDYLMELNVLAGRSYNDITQYPVFPWVISDFSSEELDLSDPATYRDLSKPIGALNIDRLQVYAQRYQDSLQDTYTSDSNSFPPFYYGSHYMSAGIALYYLCRMEPFATLYINLHGGRFEIPDRTFYSIANAWDLSLNNMGDVKELIPEMYYFPEFLRNLNKFPLGHRSDESQEEINDVGLPKWADGSPEEFVRIMREALESDYVSSNLHAWIDLIFGYKQRGDEAIAAHNVFFYLTYAGAVDPDSISDPTIKAATEQQIYHFGQTPNVLFPEPHPPRMEKKKCQHWLCELCFDLHDAPLQPFKICQFKLVEQPSALGIIRSGQCLKLFDTTERILSFELPLLAHLDPAQPAKSTQLRNIIDASSNAIPPELPIFELMPPDWSDSIVYQSFVVSSNGLYGITAGYLDCSIKVHWLKDGLTLLSLTGLENGHNDIVTCLALDYDSQDMLLSGCKDGSIVHWSAMLRSSKPGRTPLLGKPYRLLSIHYDAVRVIAVNSKVGIIVSAADDATIALYSIARKRFVREILFEGRDTVCSRDTSYHEVVLITITDTAYIIIHSIDDRVPYLRVMSINGILIKKMKLNEILFVCKTDSTNKILITGGQSCRVQFRWVHNLQLITEIATIPMKGHLKKPKKRGSRSRSAYTAKCISPSSLHEATQSHAHHDMSHSSAWRQQRFPFSANHLRRGSISNVLLGQRQSILNNKKKEKNKTNNKNNVNSARISTHFHGRFHSVDSNAILSESRIIDFDLDPDNTYLVVVLLNININAAELLLYPLPNTRHMHQFDKFVHSCNKVLQTAKNTIWENIIYVIENTESHDTDGAAYDEEKEKRWNHAQNVSDLYFKDNNNNNINGNSSNTSPKGGQLIMETGKQIISKIKTIKNINVTSNDSLTASNNVLSNKLNAFKSLWKKQ